jgi:hypothetical protein
MLGPASVFGVAMTKQAVSSWHRAEVMTIFCMSRAHPQSPECGQDEYIFPHVVRQLLLLCSSSQSVCATQSFPFVRFLQFQENCWPGALLRPLLLFIALTTRLDFRCRIYQRPSKIPVPG